MKSSAPRAPEWRDLVVLATLVCATALVVHGVSTPGLIGLLNDDGAYAIFGRALATGLGFVDMQYPEHPPATLYPIGFPLIVAASLWGVTDLSAQVARLLWVSPIAMAFFTGLTFLYFRRWGGLPLWLGTLMTLAIATNPICWSVGTLLLSDFVFAALGLMALMALERGWHGAAPSRRFWLAGGMLIGASGLVRYAGAALILAAVLVSIQARMWTGLRWMLGGFLAIFGPWMLYRVQVGGEKYHESLAGLLALDPATFGHQVKMAFTQVFANGLPGIVAPTMIHGDSIVAFLVGIGLMSLVLVGALFGLLRPAADRTPLPASYLVVTIAMVLVWDVQYAELGPDLVGRLLIPVAPFVVLCLMRGIREVLARSIPTSWAVERAVLMALFGASIVGGSAEIVHRFHDDATRHHQAATVQAYEGLFDYVRRRVPPEARMLSLMSPMVNFYTSRPCERFPAQWTVRDLFAVLVSERIDYFVSLPFLVPRGPGLSPSVMTNRSNDLIAPLATAFPESFQVVYVDSGGTVSVLRIDQTALAKRWEATRSGARP